MCISYMPRTPPATDAFLANDKLCELFSTSTNIGKNNNNDQQHAPHEPHFVQHNYHDHARDVIPESQINPPIARGGVRCPFPLKLHEMLDEIEKDGYASVISWQPHGRSFVVHKPKEFVRHVMPVYFNQSKFSSFQRQLNLYGFNRITQGLDKGGYYHELFLRGKRPLTRRIQRTKVKGTYVRGRSSPESEPNFYAMSFIDRCGNVIAYKQDEEEPDNEISDATCHKEPIISDDSTETTVDETASDLSFADETDLLSENSMEPLVVTSLSLHEPIEDTPTSAEPVTSWCHQPLTDSAAEDDDVMTFEGKTFHYLEPNDYDSMQADVDMARTALNSQEMACFLDSLKIQQRLADDILNSMDDENAFGSLLERVIE